jgi:FAD/FMN-containing dehydrogenase
MARAVVEPATLAELDASFGGSLVTPDAPGYDDARKVFNAMIDRRPAVVARCSGVADVMAALALAREHELEVAVRCGGHSVSGQSVCDGGILIDVPPMKNVWVDPGDRTAWVQARCNWGQLDRETQACGLAVTGGRTPDTGVTGLTLGGGSGWLERKYGFTVDSVLAVDLVTAERHEIRASADENSELFWALRGGGGHFGGGPGQERGASGRVWGMSPAPIPSHVRSANRKRGASPAASRRSSATRRSSTSRRLAPGVPPRRTTPVVVDSTAFGKLYRLAAQPRRFAVDGAGRSSGLSPRLEGHAAFGVERVTAAVRIT